MAKISGPAEECTCQVSCRLDKMQGIMQWKSLRKKLKASSSSSLANHPPSCNVVGSNSYDGVKTLDDITFVLKHSVHSMDMDVPAYCARESVCYHSKKHTGSLGKSWKKNKENPAWSKNNWLPIGMWDVTCCMTKAEDEERWIFKKLKMQKMWIVRGLKDLKKVNTFSGCTYAGAVAEPNLKMSP